MVYREILKPGLTCASIREQGVTVALIKVKRYPAETRELLWEGVEVHDTLDNSLTVCELNFVLLPDNQKRGEFFGKVNKKVNLSSLLVYSFLIQGFLKGISPHTI